MPDHKIEQEHENKSWEFGENRFPERRLSIFWLSDEWSDEQNKQAQEETEKTVLAHRLFAEFEICKNNFCDSNKNRQTIGMYSKQNGFPISRCNACQRIWLF